MIFILVVLHVFSIHQHLEQTQAIEEQEAA